VPKFSKHTAETITAHQLARRLLCGPDLPTFVFDPSQIDLAEEEKSGLDASIAPPVVAYAQSSDGGSPDHVIVCGDSDLNAEADRLEDLLDTESAFKWLERLMSSGTVQLMRNADGRAAIVTGNKIFVGGNLEHAIEDGMREES
jgi:hypothetical protein